MASDRKQTVACSAALAGIALLLAVVSFSTQWHWGFFDLFSFQPRYADTVALLAAGQAHHAGLDVYASNPLDPLHRPHVYGPAWLVTGALGLTVRDATWVGPLLIVIFLCTASAVLAPRRGSHLVLACALLWSPPVLLGIDRANNDLVVFLLLAAGAWLLSRAGATWLGGAAVIILATVLKFYPIAALPVLALRGRTRRFAIVACGLALTVIALVVWFWRGDFRQAIHLAPHPETIFAYGAPVTYITWRAVGPWWGAFALGLGLGVGLSLLMLLPRRRRLWTCVPATGFTSLAFLSGALCWVACFAGLSNFPYRFALLLLPARLWFEQASDPADRNTGLIQVALWSFVGWLTVAKQSWTSLAAAAPHLDSGAWVGLKLVCGVEQGLAIGLTLALAGSVAGALVRWWSSVRNGAPAHGLADPVG